MLLTIVLLFAAALLVTFIGSLLHIASYSDRKIEEFRNDNRD